LTSQQPKKKVSVKAEARRLNNTLHKIVDITRQAPRLYELSIKAYDSRRSRPLDEPKEYIPLLPIYAALSMENLNVLVLDLPGGFFIQYEAEEERRHICLAIGALLDQVQHLRLRMIDICPEVLKPRDLKKSLRLKSVIVHMGLAPEGTDVSHLSHSLRCGTLGGAAAQLNREMTEQASSLAAQMASPKLVRIITKSYPDGKSSYLDVLTGKKMMLEETADWDEEGEISQYEYLAPQRARERLAQEQAELQLQLLARGSYRATNCRARVE
jgi:hypothetical protein